jgi:hypothetical protein
MSLFIFILRVTNSFLLPTLQQLKTKATKATTTTTTKGLFFIQIVN